MQTGIEGQQIGSQIASLRENLAKFSWGNRCPAGANASPGSQVTY